MQSNALRQRDSSVMLKAYVSKRDSDRVVDKSSIRPSVFLSKCGALSFDQVRSISKLLQLEEAPIKENGNHLKKGFAIEEVVGFSIELACSTEC